MAREKLKKGDRVVMLRVTCDVVIPNGQASEGDVTEWLEYGLGARGNMLLTNPLSTRSVEALPGTVKWNVVRAGVLG